MIPDALSGGPHFAAYSERYIRHTKGRWAGQPLVFEDWQKEFWWEALEFDPATGLRVYNEVGLGLPRKNSKSTMTSAMGIYLLDADGEPEPEVYVAAAARAQAGIVMGQSIRMVQASPLLLDRLVPRRAQILAPRTGGVMRSLSADAALQHGLNPSGNIVDELHAHKSPDLWTALTTGTGAREQPLSLWISTAGVADEGVLYDIYNSMFLGNGELERRGFLTIYRNRADGVLIYWYGAALDADIEDPAVWMGTNPASWLTPEILGQSYRKLRARGAVTEWRRYHLNQFLGVEESWLPDGAWRACKSDLPLNPVLPVGVGLDRAPDGKIAALVVAQKQGDKMVVRHELFPPDASGTTSGEAMRARCREIRLQFPAPAAREDKTRRVVPGPTFGYDKVALRETAELLEEDGLNMIDSPTLPSYMAPASTTTYELVTTGRLCHDGDEVFAEHVNRTMAVLTERGMKVVRPKAGASLQNVLCVALVRAVALAVQEPPKPFAKPSHRGAVGF